jgi:alkylation response protein AidB-like acyl-CoA dehydrogenase
MAQTSPTERPAAQELPAPEEFVRRAEALQPQMRERAPEAEKARRLPDETFQDFIDADFHKILQPKRFGGCGLAQDTAAEVVATIARADGSSGWIANLICTHAWQIGLFSLEAQEEVWGDNPEAFSASASFAPRSELTEVDGGYRISGHWKFASGCDFATWFMIMKATPDNNDWFLVPRADVRVVDDWFVSGLCATGSKDIILDEVFIPSHRVIPSEDLFRGQAPGALLSEPVANASLGFPGPAIMGLPSALVGMANGLADAFQRGMVGKRALFTGELQVERVANQMKLTEARADLDAAMLIMRHRLAQQSEWGRTGVPEDPVEAMTPHRDAAYIVRLLVRTATQLTIASGATAVYHKSPIQRYMRDIMAGSSHAGVAWDAVAESYGRARWGLSPKG